MRDRVRREPRGRAAPRRHPRAPYPDLDRDARRGTASADPRPTWSRRARLGRRAITNEVEAYAARVEAERRSQEQVDDLAADAARIAAPDTRAVAVGRALD